MPEVPAVPRASELSAAVAAAFAPGGALARALPGFEARPAQLDMAAAVAGIFADGGILLAEAGTGTGKTLAYLVPAILSRQRVLVSTGTKNLQEQIYFKDLPVLREALGVPFTATYMKGRGNYLCLHRFDALRDIGHVQPEPGFDRDAGNIYHVQVDRRVVARDRDRRPGRDRGSARRICRSGTTSRRRPRTASAPTARATRTASSSGCGSAPPSPTSSSSTITCCAPTRPCGRAPSAR